jgi:acetyl esterase/lipase
MRIGNRRWELSLCSDINRRLFLTATAYVAGLRNVRADPAPEEIVLWPEQPPGGPGPRGEEQINSRGSVTGVLQPRMAVHRPSRPNGMAVLVAAGGGYAHIEAGHESAPACRWLQSLGVTGFELFYRLPQDGWPAVAPFQDAQRAMRTIRAHAAEYRLDLRRIGALGFSAGAHLVAMTAARPTARLYSSIDPADALSARPDFLGLIYPVLTMMPPFDHTRSRRELLGEHPSVADSAAWSVERQVDAHTPPTFLAQAADDPISPVDNSLMTFQALRAAQVPAEMHIFQSGRHGWGMGKPGSEVMAWPALFATWAAMNGFLSEAVRNG